MTNNIWLRLIRMKFRYEFTHIPGAGRESTDFLQLGSFLVDLQFGKGLLTGLWHFIAGQRVHFQREGIAFS